MAWVITVQLRFVLFLGCSADGQLEGLIVEKVLLYQQAYPNQVITDIAWRSSAAWKRMLDPSTPVCISQAPIAILDTPLEVLIRSQVSIDQATVKEEQEDCEYEHENAVEEQEPSADPHWAERVTDICVGVVVRFMDVGLTDQLPDAGDNHREDQNVERRDEKNEIGVIVPSNARTQPDTVVIELIDAIVTEVAMGWLRWPENQTRLTKLHRGECRVAKVGTVSRFALSDKVKDALALMMNICVLWIHFIDCISWNEGRWYYSRIYTPCV